MRILLVGHSYVVDLNRDKLRALATARPGVEVVGVVPRRWSPGGVGSSTVVSEPLREGALRVVPLAALPRRHQSLLTFGPGLLPLLARFRPQVIQVEQGAKSLAYAQCILLARLLRLDARRVFFTWWNLPYRLRFPVRQLQAFNLAGSHAAVAGNRDAAEVLRQQGFEGPIRVLPQLGVDPDRFQPAPRSGGWRRRLGLADDDFVVGYAGRLVEEKGLLTLWRAVAGLRGGWKLLVVGGGPLESALRRRAEALGIGTRVAWAGAVPHAEMPDLLRQMDVLVLPSESSSRFRTLTARGWKEQFGHVLVEAMACGVPVVGSCSGEIPQVVGDAGQLFPEGDARALREALVRLRGEPEEARRLGRRGRERVERRFTHRALADRLLAFYDELLETTGSSPPPTRGGDGGGG